VNLDREDARMSWDEALYQREVWLAAGQPVRIDEMTRRYRFNAARWLIRRAHSLSFRVSMDMVTGYMPSGDMASDAFEVMGAFYSLAADPESEDYPYPEFGDDPQLSGKAIKAVLMTSSTFPDYKKEAAEDMS
jgi:hypothetical protein